MRLIVGMMSLFSFWILCPHVLLQGFVFHFQQKSTTTTSTTIPIPIPIPMMDKNNRMLYSTATQTNFYMDNNEKNDSDDNDDFSILLCPSSYPSKTFGAKNLEITFQQIDTDTDTDTDNKGDDDDDIVQLLPLQKYHAREYSRRTSTMPTTRVVSIKKDLNDISSSSSSRDGNGDGNNNAESSRTSSLMFDVCSDIPSLDFIYENISRFQHLTKSSISLLEEYYNTNNNNNNTNNNNTAMTMTKTTQQEQELPQDAYYRRRKLRSKIRAECRASLSLIPKRTLRILYCDSHICVVNKPSGVLSVPGHRRNPSLANLVYDTIQPSSTTASLSTTTTTTTSATGSNHESNNDITSSIDNIDQSVVHRLDMATSGIIVYALTKEALSKLHITFRDRVVKKTYHALVEGHLLLPPPDKDEDEKSSDHPNPLSSTSFGGRLEGEIDVDMERDPNNPPYMRIAQPRTKNNSINDSDDDEGDQQDDQKSEESFKRNKEDTTTTRINHKFLKEAPKPSKTTWSILSYEYRDDGKPVTRLEMRPHTGRTHQLRVHASQVLGTPIVGDDIYGSGGKNGSYTLCLHAQKLCIHHPISGAAMIFEADAPF